MREEVADLVLLGLEVLPDDRDLGPTHAQDRRVARVALDDVVQTGPQAHRDGVAEAVALDGRHHLVHVAVVGVHRVLVDALDRDQEGLQAGIDAVVLGHARSLVSAVMMRRTPVPHGMVLGWIESSMMSRPFFSARR